MKNTNETRSKVFRFVLLIKHAKNNISNGMKETIEERTVIEKESAKFFRNSKHTVTMDTANELTGHMKRALLPQVGQNLDLHRKGTNFNSPQSGQAKKAPPKEGSPQ